MEPEAHPQPDEWRNSDSVPALQGLDDLERMFDAACDAIDRMRAQVRTELGLSAVECLVVRLLAREPLTVGELTRRTSVGRSSISMAVGRLEKRGMVIRPSRARRAPIDLTESVRHRYRDACRAPARTALADWTMEHDSATLDAATTLLTGIGTSVEEARAARRTRDAIATLHDALLRADLQGCLDTARTLMVDGAIAPAYSALLQALDRIHATRDRRSATALDDHPALLTATRATERLHRLGRSARPIHRSALVLPVQAGDADLGTRMAANELERAGWEVHLLSGGLTPDVILTLRSDLATDVVILGVACADAVPPALDLARDLAPHMPVAAFGTALTSEVLGSRFEATGASVRGTLDRFAANIDELLPPVDHRAS